MAKLLTSVGLSVLIAGGVTRGAPLTIVANGFDLDVTKLVKPGRNAITIRVFNDADVGGWSRRGFFWSPKERQ